MSDTHSIKSSLQEPMFLHPTLPPGKLSLFIGVVLPHPKSSFQPIPASSPSEIRAMNQKGFKAQESSGCAGCDLKGSDFLGSERPA